MGQTYLDEDGLKALWEKIKARTGTTLYETTENYGIYCNGGSTHGATGNYAVLSNDTSISDFSAKYHTLQITVRTPRSTFIASMPTVSGNEWDVDTVVGSYNSGCIFPAFDHADGYGAAKHYMYSLRWHLDDTQGDVRLVVTESGYYNYGIPEDTQANYTNNSTSLVTATGSMTWNPRHNSGYSIIKIVGIGNGATSTGGSMQKLYTKTFINAATTPTVSDICYNNPEADAMTLTVRGTFTSLSALVEIKTDPNGGFTPVGLIGMADCLLLENGAISLSANGEKAYQFSLAGVYATKVTVSAVAGGNVTIFGVGTLEGD